MGLPISLIEAETGASPRFSVIWMHGLGADGSDFEPIVPMLGIPDNDPVRFVFPNAPAIPVTCNGGWVMPAWYDIVSLGPTERKVDEAGIRQSRDVIRYLIDRESERGIPSERIVLAGFSQGGAIAYVTALTHPRRLAGILALSTYLPTPDLVAREQSPANSALPVFVGHGSDDDVVSPMLGAAAVAELRRNRHRIEEHIYPMAHEVCPSEIQDIGLWLRQQLAASR